MRDRIGEVVGHARDVSERIVAERDLPGLGERRVAQAVADELESEFGESRVQEMLDAYGS